MVAGILLTTALTWLLYLSGVFVLWTPLPLLYAFTRRGWSSFWLSFAVALSGIALLTFTLLLFKPGLAEQVGVMLPGISFQSFFGKSAAVGFSLLYFIYYGGLAAGLLWAHRQAWSLIRTFVVLVFSPLALVALCLVIGYVALDWDVWGYTYRYMALIFEQLTTSGATENFSGRELDFLVAHKEKVVTQIVQMLPAAAIIGAIITVWCNVLGARGWRDPDTEQTFFHTWGALSRWRLSEAFIWLPITGAALFFGDTYLLNSGWLVAIALNILWVSATIYFFQGLALVSFWLQSRASLFLKVMVYGTIIVFFQLVALALIVLGIFDIWFDFRRGKQEVSGG